MAENEDARKTVYEISQEDGFEGTMEQFDERLKKRGALHRLRSQINVGDGFGIQIGSWFIGARRLR